MEGVFHGAPRTAQGLASLELSFQSMEYEWRVSQALGSSQFNVVPNVWEWLPGDVLLYINTGWFIENLKRTSINIYQEITEQLSVDACKVFHVALYDGQGYFWDLTIADNVVRREVRSVLQDPKEKFILRRLSVESDPERLMKILDDSATLLYAKEKLTAARMFWNRFKDRPPPNVDPSLYAVCSSFVAECLYEATGTDPLAGAGTLPGDFYDNPAFATVPVKWTVYRNKASQEIAVEG